MMNLQRPICILCWLLGAAITALFFAFSWSPSAVAAEPAAADFAIVKITAEPTEFTLNNEFDYRQILILGETAEGESVDLTRIAKIETPPSTVSLNEMRLASPLAAGSETLKFSHAGMSVEVAVTVNDLSAEHDTLFGQDVQPVLSRLGCNQGTCHGSKDGKNGFKLSLRGYDSLYDYRALTDDIGARRFNRAAPDQSLFLLKASGSIPHVGGVLTSPGEPHYEILKRWITRGATFDKDASPKVVGIEISPNNPIVPRAGMKQQIRVTATFSDGEKRDVTREAFIESGNIEVISAKRGGLLTMLRRGESPVLVRYQGAYAATTLTVMGDRSGFEWTQPPTFNYIDELVYDKLKRMKIQASELCRDDEFIRRVYLDLTGLPPTSDDVRNFLSDERPTQVKRGELVDQLIGGREYTEHWANKWADMLQVNRKFVGEEGAIALRAWIKDNVARNTPYDDFAREVLTASGSNLDNPPAAYFKILRDPAATMENTTHLFLSVRFNCNKCHDHPFERWTQDQYYELASYFAQVGLKADPKYKGKKIGGSAVEGAKPLVEVIYDKKSGDVTHDRTGVVTAPHFPYTHDDVAPDGLSRRAQLAHWITSPENQYFAKSYANRLWGYLFGIGIIEPIDDIRAGNPPTNPELLDALTRDFIEHDFDVQHMLRTICKSRVYQHSMKTNRWNEGDGINYSHALPRRLPAEVLYDSIHLAAGAPLRIPGAPAGLRAAELPDVGIKVPFLDDWGRPARETSCECERSHGVILGPVMKLVNGPTVANAIADPANAIHKLAKEEKDDAKLVEELFLRFLGRRPDAAEIEIGRLALYSAGAGYDEAVAELKAYEATLPPKLAAWESDLNRPTEWTVLKPTELKSKVGGAIALEEDGSIFASGKLGKDLYTIVAPLPLKQFTGIKLEALADKRLPAGGPGRAKNGNFVLNELKASISQADAPSEFKSASLGNAVASFSQTNWAVTGAVDGNISTGWAVSPSFNKNHTATFEANDAVELKEGAQLKLTFDQQYTDGAHLLGRFRISVTSSPTPFGGGSIPANILAIVKTPADQRTAEQQQSLLAFFQTSDREYQRLKTTVSQLDNERKNARLIGAQDLTWALINNPAFLFNR